MKALLEWVPALLSVVVIYWFIIDPVTVLLLIAACGVTVLLGGLLFKRNPIAWIKRVLSKLFS